MVTPPPLIAPIVANSRSWSRGARPGDGAPREDARAVGAGGHAVADQPVGRGAGEPGAVEQDVPPANVALAVDGPEHRRLAGPVRADDGHDLPVARLERHAAEDLRPPVARPQLPHLDPHQALPR